MTINDCKHQHYDPKPDNAQYDAEGNPLPPKKTYNIDGNEIKPEEDELITESETTLTEVDCGFMMLFIGQFMLIGSFDDTGVPQAFFFSTMQGCADQMPIVCSLHVLVRRRYYHIVEHYLERARGPDACRHLPLCDALRLDAIVILRYHCW